MVDILVLTKPHYHSSHPHLTNYFKQLEFLMELHHILVGKKNQHLPLEDEDLIKLVQPCHYMSPITDLCQLIIYITPVFYDSKKNLPAIRGDFYCTSLQN